MYFDEVDYCQGENYLDFMTRCLENQFYIFKQKNLSWLQ